MMGPSGSSNPIGGAQSVPPSLLRSNSGLMGAQGGSLPSQTPFSSIVSPRTQFNNINMLGNMPSLVNQQPFGNGGPNIGFSGPGSTQRGCMDNGAESDPLSNGLGFNPGSSGGQQFSNPSVNQQQLEQQQFQHMRGGVGPVKMEPQNLGPVKLEPQQRNLGQVKMEPQHSDQSLFLHQQQQYLMSRQSPQAAAILQQQRMLQMQQQQQILKQQRPPQQFAQQNLPLRSPVKQPTAYEPGMCARRLTHYMYQQQHRPEDNNIEFWRKFVGEYFAPNAKKKWCVSMYGSGRQTTGVFPQDALRCEICNRKPGRGFEATVEVLPRLFKIKYESGTIEELLYIDMPREYQNSAGQIVLDYAKAIQESVFHQLRVVREGQLRIVFTPDLKIVSWEFCAWRHEELIPRRLLIPQVSQLGAAAQKYQTATQNASNLSPTELQSNCNAFVTSVRQLAKALEVPLVNDLGYTKRYVRCLQISEVVNSMKDLIDYSRETGSGPMESLAKYPRRTSSSLGPRGQAQQHEEQQQQQQQISNNERSAILASAVQLTSNNGIASVNNPLPPSTNTNTNTVGLHQNSMNSRQQNLSINNNVSSPYGGNPVQMPSPSSSNQAQPTPPFQGPTPSSSNNPQTPANHLGPTNSPANIPNEADTNDQQSSVEKIIQEMMMSTSGNMANVGSSGNDVKNINGVNNNNNPVVLNGTMNNNPSMGMGGGGFSTMGSGISHSAMMNGIRAAMGHNSMMNGRVAMNMGRDQSMNQQDMYGGLGSVNGFNNIQFDWKPSP